jgi:hypothetical protein
MATVGVNKRTVFCVLCMPLLGVAGALFLHTRATVPYYNCGDIWFGGPAGILDLNQARAGEACLWQHYRAGTPVQLTAEDARSSDTVASHLFTFDPADRTAPFHDAISFAGNGLTSTGAATCRGMLSTAIGVELVGCNAPVFTPLYRNYTGGYPSPP